MNNEVINAAPLYLNAPKMALDFLVGKLGFVVQEHGASKTLDGVLICDSYGNFYEVILDIRNNEGRANNFNLFINTADCLQDFYNMEPKGVCIINKPHYVAEGLMFEILDPWNNKYTFLEKRDYTDQ